MESMLLLHVELRSWLDKWYTKLLVVFVIPVGSLFRIYSDKFLAINSLIEFSVSWSFLQLKILYFPDFLNIADMTTLEGNSTMMIHSYHLFTVYRN